MEEVAEPPGGDFMSQGGQALNNHVGIYRDMLEYRRIISKANRKEWQLGWHMTDALGFMFKEKYPPGRVISYCNSEVWFARGFLALGQ